MTTLQELREFAKTLDDTSEGWSCKGTVLESRTIKVDGRAFLFLGTKGVVRLKLEDSIPEAKKLSKKHPDVYEIGSGNWTKIVLDDDVDRDVMEKWITESYDLILNFRTGGSKKKPAKPKRKR